jgi:hypothetical protein
MFQGTRSPHGLGLTGTGLLSQPCQEEAGTLLTAQEPRSFYSGRNQIMFCSWMESIQEAFDKSILLGCKAPGGKSVKVCFFQDGVTIRFYWLILEK